MAKLAGKRQDGQKRRFKKESAGMLRRSTRLTAVTKTTPARGKAKVKVERKGKGTTSSGKVLKLSTLADAAKKKQRVKVESGNMNYDKVAVEKVIRSAQSLRLGADAWSVEDGLRHLLSVNPRVFGPAIQKFGIPRKIVDAAGKSDADRLTNPFSSSLWPFAISSLLVPHAAVMRKVCAGLGVDDSKDVTPSLILSSNFEEKLDTSTGKWRVEINGIHAGLSRNKAKYIRSLAEHFDDSTKLGGVRLDDLF